MVRTRESSKRALLGTLALLALDQGQDRLLVPSISWLRTRSGMDWRTVSDTLAWLSTAGRVDVAFNPDRTIWITVRR